jgi:hypothetical protein
VSLSWGRGLLNDCTRFACNKQGQTQTDLQCVGFTRRSQLLPLLRPFPLVSRSLLQLGDKADLIKRGVAPHDAADKVAGTMSALLDAIKEWRSEGTRMANA